MDRSFGRPRMTALGPTIDGPWMGPDGPWARLVSPLGTPNCPGLTPRPAPRHKRALLACVPRSALVAAGIGSPCATLARGCGGFGNSFKGNVLIPAAWPCASRGRGATLSPAARAVCHRSSPQPAEWRAHCLAAAQVLRLPKYAAGCKEPRRSKVPVSSSRLGEGRCPARPFPRNGVYRRGFW